MTDLRVLEPPNIVSGLRGFLATFYRIFYLPNEISRKVLLVTDGVLLPIQSSPTSSVSGRRTSQVAGLPS